MVSKDVIPVAKFPVKTKVWMLFPEIVTGERENKKGEESDERGRRNLVEFTTAHSKRCILDCETRLVAGWIRVKSFWAKFLNAPRSDSNFLGNAPLIRSALFAMIRDSLGKFLLGSFREMKR